VPGAGAPAEGARRPLVLVAEDEPDSQEILATVIEEFLGWRTALVANGREALEAVRRERPDLILLDLLMPVVDGFEVARRLKSDPATAAIPTIALTALARPEDRQLALDAGCDGFLAKPFELDAVERALKEWLGDRPA
jgi:CheY-like chemotaxis protein